MFHFVFFYLLFIPFDLSSMFFLSRCSFFVLSIFKLERCIWNNRKVSFWTEQSTSSAQEFLREERNREKEINNIFFLFHFVMILYFPCVLHSIFSIWDSDSALPFCFLYFVCVLPWQSNKQTIAPVDRWWWYSKETKKKKLKQTRFSFVNFIKSVSFFCIQPHQIE